MSTTPPANGRITQYEYDDLNRLLEENWLDEYEQIVYTISYTYNAVGNMLTASDDAATYTYEYDALGRLTEETQTIDCLTPTIVFTSEYNANSQRTELAAVIGGADDFINAYDYDALGRLYWLTQTGAVGGNAVTGKVVSITYDAAGRYDIIARCTDVCSWQDVIFSVYTYDDANRLIGLEHTHLVVGLLRDFAWTYDAVGNITSHDSDIAAEDVTDYTHDDANQLTDADYTTGTDESYTYDENGNRVTANGSTYETDTNNRLVSDGYFRYEYDAEGNLIYRYVDEDSSESLNAGDTDITEYAWDHRNRMADVVHRDVFGGDVDWTAEYVYDAFNRRVGALYDLDGNSNVDLEERYVWDGRNVVLDFVDADGDGGTYSLELTNRYLWGQAVDQLFAQETVDDGGAEDVSWPLTDNLGSVRSLVNYLGQITATYSYDSFGNVTVQAGVLTDTRYHFTCQEYDPATGFYYYDARWYDPTIGKFVSEDPISFFGGDANLYRYVGNNSLKYVDPWGYCKKDSDGSDTNTDENTKGKQKEKSNEDKKPTTTTKRKENPLDTRTWRNKKNEVIVKGKVVKVTKTHIYVQEEGKAEPTKIPRDQLSQGDENYLKNRKTVISVEVGEGKTKKTYKVTVIGGTTEQEDTIAANVVKAQEQIAELKKEIKAAIDSGIYNKNLAVLFRLKNALRTLNAASRVLSDCSFKIESSSSDAMAKAFPIVGAFTSSIGRTVYIYPTFWLLTDEAQAATLVHEATHIGVGTTDAAYFWQSGREPETVTILGIIPMGWDAIASTYDSWILNGFFVPDVTHPSTLPQHPQNFYTEEGWKEILRLIEEQQKKEEQQNK